MASPPSLPQHHVCVGNHIVVFFNEEKRWCQGEIVDVRGDHDCEIVYIDGDRKWVSLDKLRFIVQRNISKRSTRETKRDSSVGGEDGGSENLESIKETLFDIVRRIAPVGVVQQTSEWWDEWRQGVLVAVENNNVAGIVNAAVALSVQIKPDIASTWWVKHSAKWMKTLKSALEVPDAALVVRELHDKAVNWAKVEELYSVAEEFIDDSGKVILDKSASGDVMPDCSFLSRTVAGDCALSLPDSESASDVNSAMEDVSSYQQPQKSNNEHTLFEKKEETTKNMEHIVCESLYVSDDSQPVEDEKKCLAGGYSVHTPSDLLPVAIIDCKRKRYNLRSAVKVPEEKRNTRSCALRTVKCSKGITDVVHNVDASLSKDKRTSQVGTCRISNRKPCTICQTRVARDLLITCSGVGCSRVFHTFCTYPPLQCVPEGKRLCSYCEQDLDKCLNKAKDILPKKIECIIGRRRLLVDAKNTWEDQFLIKWESLSHHHDTWVPIEWLSCVDPIRLCSFQNHYPVFDETTSLIDLRKPEWLNIDRVIACRRKSTAAKWSNVHNLSLSEHSIIELEFLVKWMGLDYCHATWESSQSIDLLSEIDKFIQRHKLALERSKIQFLKNHFPKFDVQPCYLKGGNLFDYQLRGLNWILDNFMSKRNVILADEMGLGKTVQVVSFVSCMKQEQLNFNPVLVIAPKSILFHWEKEFRNWAEVLNVVIYQGERRSRLCIQAHELYSSEKRVLFDVLVTNYEQINLDKGILRKFKWSALIIDEAHKLKSLDCKLTSCLKEYSADFRLLLTGTPLQNTLVELFALLHFLDPTEFSDPKGRAESFSTIGSEIMNSQSLESNRSISQIHDLLKPRMLRRIKSDVLPDMIPIKKWVEVPCALSDTQRSLYVNLLQKNYEELNKRVDRGKRISLNSLLMELRKCCNHPFLFPGQELSHGLRPENLVSLVSSSGKLQLLEKLLPKLKERGNRVLLFSQFTTMLDILEDFLYLLGFEYLRIDGKTAMSSRQEQMDKFNSPESSVFVFLLSTRAAGQGVDLPSADRVIIYDPDFNPFMDLQAQSRAHRIGQSRPVVVYQLITKCTVEEKILQKSKKKLAIENLVMNPNTKLSVADLHSVLLHGAKKILSDENVQATSIHYDDEAIETLLKKDPAPGDKCSQEDNGYLGGIDSFTPEPEEPPSSPKPSQWAMILAPTGNKTTSTEMGRGKRQKSVVKYDSDDESDNDDIYSPENSSIDAESSSSDDDYLDADDL